MPSSLFEFDSQRLSVHRACRRLLHRRSSLPHQVRACLWRRPILRQQHQHLQALFARVRRVHWRLAGNMHHLQRGLPQIRDGLHLERHRLSDFGRQVLAEVDSVVHRLPRPELPDLLDESDQLLILPRRLLLGSGQKHLLSGGFYELHLLSAVGTLAVLVPAAVSDVDQMRGQTSLTEYHQIYRLYSNLLRRQLHRLRGHTHKVHHLQERRPNRRSHLHSIEDIGSRALRSRGWIACSLRLPLSVVFLEQDELHHMPARLLFRHQRLQALPSEMQELCRA